MYSVGIKKNIGAFRVRSKSERLRDSIKSSGAINLKRRQFLLTEDLDNWLSLESQATGVSRSAVIRQAIFDRAKKTDSRFKIN